MKYTRFNEFLFSERERLPLFVPVILGAGIIFGVFFPFTSWSALLSTILTAFLISVIIYKKSKILCCTCLVFTLGFYVVQTGGILCTDLLSQKKFISEEYDNIKFEAIVKSMDETHPVMKNMRRITFKDMNISNINYIKTAKMTCSVKMTEHISPGNVVRVKGKFIPFKPPAIPGAFDQIQYNSLIGIDATGVVYNIVKLGESSSFDNWINKIRRKLTQSILEKMPPPAGGIASALLSGDKSAIPTEVREKFIASGTAHILAISGLHMSIVASIVFLAFTKLLQYLSCICNKISPKKCAATITIPATFLYLALSGFSPSATRAFIMTTVFLVSVMCGRGSLSLRSVAVAAFLILIFDPGALFLVSFQLSFCAVVALVAFYEAFQPALHNFMQNHSGIVQKLASYIVTTLASTIIASMATLPISIAVFNRLSISGVVGNLVAIPLVTFAVIPLGIICLIFHADFLVSMLSFILNKLHTILSYISEIPGSNIVVKSPEISDLYIIIIGGIVLCLLKTKVRLIGTIPIAVGILGWIFRPPPDIIFPPGVEIACFIENNNFYTTSLKKGRRVALSVQRNLGFSGKLSKKGCQDGKWKVSNYSNGLYIWTKSGKTQQLAKRKHPYCPAYWDDY